MSFFQGLAQAARDADARRERERDRADARAAREEDRAFKLDMWQRQVKENRINALAQLAGQRRSSSGSSSDGDYGAYVATLDGMLEGVEGGEDIMAMYRARPELAQQLLGQITDAERNSEGRLKVTGEQLVEWITVYGDPVQQEMPSISFEEIYSGETDWMGDEVYTDALTSLSRPESDPEIGYRMDSSIYYQPDPQQWERQFELFESEVVRAAELEAQRAAADGDNLESARIMALLKDETPKGAEALYQEFGPQVLDTLINSDSPFWNDVENNELIAGMLRGLEQQVIPEDAGDEVNPEPDLEEEVPNPDDLVIRYSQGEEIIVTQELIDAYPDFFGDFSPGDVVQRPNLDTAKETRRGRVRGPQDLR